MTDPTHPRADDHQERVAWRVATDHTSTVYIVDPSGRYVASTFDRSEAERIVAGMNRRVAQPEPQQQGGEFSLERIDGTKDSYKLYAGRHQPIGDGFMVGHGLWLCTISDFDANGEQTRARIIAALNAAPAPAAPVDVRR